MPDRIDSPETKVYDTRWDRDAAADIEAPKVAAFLREVLDVCRRHGFSISHEDEHGGFIVEPFSEDRARWFADAMIDFSPSDNDDDDE